MQASEKAQLELELEKLLKKTRKANEEDFGCTLKEFYCLLANYSGLNNEFIARKQQLSELSTDEDFNKKIKRFHSYIKYLYKIESGSRWLGNASGKTELEGTSSSLLYSHSIDFLYSEVLNNKSFFNEALSKGVFDFYYNVLYYACGAFINKNCNVSKILEIQDELLLLKNDITPALQKYADFKVISIVNNFTDITEYSSMSIKLFQIALTNVLIELKDFVTNLSIVEFKQKSKKPVLKYFDESKTFTLNGISMNLTNAEAHCIKQIYNREKLEKEAVKNTVSKINRKFQQILNAKLIINKKSKPYQLDENIVRISGL